MTVIAVAPFTLKDIDLKIAADNYEAHVSQVEFTPTTAQVTWKGLTPTAVYTDQTSPTWTCTLSGAQDWDTANSLAQYLLANAGQQKIVIFKPKKGTAGTMRTFTATCTMVPTTIGGTIDTVPVFTVTLGVVGAPVPSLT